MARLTFGALLAFPLFIAFGAHSVAAHLERATATQCAANAWPAYQHAAHLQWCQANSYPTTY